jgi:DNA repair protein SbcD/Mre11
MKLFHAADIHLDSPMRGLSVYDHAPVAELRMATRAALANLVDAAIEERVALMLLAGDIFDGDWANYGTGLQFVSEMGRLREADIPVVIGRGNHDAESKLTKSLRLPDNVHVLATRKPETIRFEDLGVAVHGQSYSRPAAFDNLALAYPVPLADLLNIGLLHTSADGRPGHESYAPCSARQLAEHGYDYWALGHVHRHEVLCADPLVLFAGNLQGRSLRETGPRGAVLVDFDADGVSGFEHRALDQVRWELTVVDASGCADRDSVCERSAVALREALDAAGGRLLATRLVIEGMSDAHTALLADPERLRYELIATAGEVGGEQVWIEAVKVETLARRPLAQVGEDAVGELIAELEDIVADEDAIAQLAAMLAPLTNVLPPGVRSEFDPEDPGLMAELMADVQRSLPVALFERGDS